MRDYYSIFLSSLLAALLTLIFTLLPTWLGRKDKLNQRTLTKIAIATTLIFLIVLIGTYAQYSEQPLPSGIDNESTNVKAAFNNIGVALCKQGNYTGAIHYYDRAIELDPEYVLAWSNKGNALKALHRDSEAENAFEKARVGEA